MAQSSVNAAQVAEAGRATVEETIAGIERMQSQMSVIADTITRLSEQTQAVGDIITTVNDLAEQSNLLSVNASIEAAKAESRVRASPWLLKRSRAWPNNPSRQCPRCGASSGDPKGRHDSGGGR